MKKKHTQALHVSVIGIDGSGKSTFAASLPMLLAAEYQLQAGGAGETYVVNTPDEDHLTSGFTPDGLPFTARISPCSSAGPKNSPIIDAFIRS